jgi:tetratricopeptide (TPR) repeat protein
MAAAHCNSGIALQSLGRFHDALRCYDRAITLQPDYADAYYNKAIALRCLNQSQDAIANYDRAIRFKPDHVEAHANKGNALRELKRPGEALESFDKAIRISPASAVAHCNRGNALLDLKRFEEARASYERAVSLQPDFAEAYNNRSNALLELKLPEQALESCSKALALNPQSAEAHNSEGNALQVLKLPEKALESYHRAIALRPGFAEAHNGLGNAMQSLNRSDEALASYDRAIALNPLLADGYNNKGNTLKGIGALKEALESFDRAIALRPDFAEAHNNRANVLQDMQRPRDALASCDCAIQINASLAAAHNNRGNALRSLAQWTEAIESYARAFAIDGGFVDAHVNAATCKLLLGGFAEGFELYEWRKKRSEPTGIRSYNQPVWTGEESLDGRTLLIHAEQGLGDTIQFCRYALLAQQRGASVILAVQDGLAHLLRSLGPEIRVEKQSATAAEFDFHIALMSMPLAFGTRLGSCPADVPYLHAEPERLARWKDRIGSEGFKIGICWQGNKQGDVDLGRSVPLRHFERLGRIPSVRLISLQKNDGVQQLSDLPLGMKVETLGDDFDTGYDAFVDAAAVIGCLDLVITSDTAIAHLAGALGHPVWVALKRVPDWRWLLDRSDSPWYPTLKLFRQPHPGDWSSVFGDMEAYLREQIIGGRVARINHEACD